MWQLILYKCSHRFHQLLKSILLVTLILKIFSLELMRRRLTPFSDNGPCPLWDILDNKTGFAYFTLSYIPQTLTFVWKILDNKFMWEILDNKVCFLSLFIWITQTQITTFSIYGEAIYNDARGIKNRHQWQIPAGTKVR